MTQPEDHYRHSPALTRSSLESEPVDQFTKWFNDACRQSPGDWFIPEAMTLSTIDTNQRPSSRIVLLKEHDYLGFVFYTHYQSRKGLALAKQPTAVLSFYWGHIQRQVRIEGSVEKVSARQSDEYFQSRPRESQLSAYSSKQSTVVESEQFLKAQVEQARQQFNDKPVTRPEQWGGYRLIADYFEFWQGRSNRLHDRFCYRKDKQQWLIERLAP